MMSLSVARLAYFALAAVFSGASFAQSDRGYDPKTLEQGKSLFQENCAGCHGMRAEGTVKDWQQKDQNGKYPPPPLNGTAHTWHHPLSGLMHTVKKGTQAIGGSMPSWENKISDDQILSIILWLTSLWPDEIFQAWLQRNQQ